jgi:hypothetical protein
LEATQPFGHLYRSTSQSIEHRGHTRISLGPARRKYSRSGAGRARQALSQGLDVLAASARENNAERVEKHQLGAMPHCRADIFPACCRDILRQSFDFLAHLLKLSIMYRRNRREARSGLSG